LEEAVTSAAAALGIDAGLPPARDAAGPVSFQWDVHPLLVKYCGDCHSVNGPYHNAASPDLAVAYADAVDFADRLVARITQGNMPPGCVFDEAECVVEPELDVIRTWISEGFAP
jgi:hypothetical protein